MRLPDAKAESIAAWAIACGLVPASLSARRLSKPRNADPPSTNADTRIRLGGTTTKIGGEGYANIFFPQASVIRTGDRISWHQYNQNAVGGLNVGFTNGTWTGWHLQDTAGQDSNQDGIENVWQYRTAVLNDYVGLTTDGIVLVKDVYSPVGDWSMLISDIAIYSADGSVQHAYSGEQESLQIYGIDPAYNSSFTAAVEVYPIIPDANTTKYYLSDQLGTTQMEFAGGGWPVWKGEFAPFGQELDTQATANRYKFTGKERDTESGLDYFGARYYSSNMGRWMSPDWADKPEAVPYSDLADPQSLNLYGYVRNNPLSRADVDGHCEDGQECGQTAASSSATVTYKAGVPAASPAVSSMLGCTAACSNQSLRVTSTSEAIPQHPEGTPHREGEAADVTVKPGTAGAVLACAAKCGAKFGQDEGAHPIPGHTTGPHVHLQTVPGKRGGRGDLPKSPAPAPKPVPPPPPPPPPPPQRTQPQ